MDSMAGYTKLFNSILASTIWREEKETKILWITMLAMADKDGMVEASIPGLSDLARLTVKETQKALGILESPDEFSRTKEHEGRRIEPVLGGWLVLNHAHYRQKMDMDERREYLRLKKQESRDRQRQQGVNNCPEVSTKSTQAESREQRADPKSNISPSEGESQIHSKPTSGKKSGGVGADPRYTPFVEQWVKLYAAHFGEPYVMNGGRDGKQLSQFLKTAPHLSLERMCDVAQRGWTEQETNPFCKACKASVTICGYVTRWNEITAELARTSTKNLVSGRKQIPQHIPGSGF